MLLASVIIAGVFGDGRLAAKPSTLVINEDTDTVTNSVLMLGEGVEWVGGKTGFNESHTYPAHEGKCFKQTEGLITRTACLKVLEEGYTILPSEPLGEPITCGANETCKVTPRGSYVMRIEGIEPLYLGFNWEQLYPTNGTNLAPLDAEGNYATDTVYTKQGPFTGELSIKPILWYTKGKITWSIESEYSIVSFAKEVDLQHIIITPNGCPDAVIALKKVY